MARRPRRDDPEKLRGRLVGLLDRFQDLLKGGDLRDHVKALVPAAKAFRDLGVSLVPEADAGSAQRRILAYLRASSGQVVTGQELAIVSGISEYARRIRELRVEQGWPIVSGVLARRMRAIELDEEDPGPAAAGGLDVDDYILVADRRDEDAADRWKLANTIRRSDGSARDKILEYLRANVGKEVTGEELSYIVDDVQEWPRRVRELRTEFGWPIVTQVTGRPDLPVGVYVLEEDRQSEPHDRHIPDAERRAALMRDRYTCQTCGWHQDLWNKADPRHLELHHIQHHRHGGANVAGNLVTLCNVCHDVRHRREAG